MATVTAGLLVFYGPVQRAFTLSARSKQLVATLELGDTGGFPIPGGPFQPGNPINISGTIAGDQTLRFGPAYYNGKRYPKLWYEGTMQFKATPVAAPGNSGNPVAVLTRFTFKGTLKAFEANNIMGGGGPPVFDVALVGRGEATVFLGASYDLGGHTLGRDPLTWLYEFD